MIGGQADEGPPVALAAPLQESLVSVSAFGGHGESSMQPARHFGVAGEMTGGQNVRPRTTKRARSTACSSGECIPAANALGMCQARTTEVAMNQQVTG